MSIPKPFAIHPAANLFPLMTQAEFDGLKADIDAHGQRESITMWKGQIIDGRNRLRACEELGREAEICELDDHHDPIAYVISHNLHRRHLTESQRAMVGASIANMKQGASGPGRAKLQICSFAIDDAAKQVKVSPRSVASAKVVKDKGTPELAAMVTDGKVSVDAASKVAKKTKAEQEAIVAKGPKAVKEAAKTVPVPKRVKPGRQKSVNKTSEIKRLFKECDKVEQSKILQWFQKQTVEPELRPKRQARPEVVVEVTS